MSKADYCGFLRKKGEKVRAYRKRWFELRGEKFLFFKKKKQKRPLGVISIGSDVKVVVNKKKANFFTVEGKDILFDLSAENKEVMDGWVKILREKIGKSKSESSVITAEEESAPVFSKKGYKTDDVGIEDFDEVKVVGRGSFAKVVKVRRRETGKIYAMKILKKEMIIKENMVEHTVREKDILSQINHPFIVGLHFAFQTEDKLYLVLEFLSGGELFFHLKEETKFSVEKAKFYIAELISALGHLHKHNIIYRDLKPENCVLNSEGHLVITDFGLAKSHVSSATDGTTFCGTPEYLAPEILKGEGHGKAVDWWSLGVLLFEMLAGLPPFYSENVNEMYELILSKPLQFPPGFSKDTKSILKGLLTRDPSKRLGGGKADAEDIKAHAFFKGLDWDKLEKKKLKPPFIPNVKGDDTRYFEPEFTREPMKQTMANPVGKKQDQAFKTFDFNREKGK